jgi:hypothetical protein
VKLPVHGGTGAAQRTQGRPVRAAVQVARPAREADCTPRRPPGTRRRRTGNSPATRRIRSSPPAAARTQAAEGRIRPAAAPPARPVRPVRRPGAATGAGVDRAGERGRRRVGAPRPRAGSPSSTATRGSPRRCSARTTRWCRQPARTRSRRSRCSSAATTRDLSNFDNNLDPSLLFSGARIKGEGLSARTIRTARLRPRRRFSRSSARSRTRTTTRSRGTRRN